MNTDRVGNPSEGGSYVRHEDGNCELVERGKTDAIVTGTPEHEQPVIDAEAERLAKEKAEATPPTRRTRIDSDQ